MGVIVRDSKIHGKGVFATRNFKKGEVVIAYQLKQITEKQFQELPEQEKHFASHDGKNNNRLLKRQCP